MPKDPIFQGDTVSYNEAFMHALDKADAASTAHTTDEPPSPVYDAFKAEQRATTITLPIDMGYDSFPLDPAGLPLSGSFMAKVRKAQDRTLDLWMDQQYGALYHEGDHEPPPFPPTPIHIRALYWLADKLESLIEWLEEK